MKLLRNLKFRSISSSLAGRSGGFTLVELIMVLAISAAMAAVALPSFFRWYTNLNYKQTTWDIVSQLRYSREKAVSDNLEARVEFDVDGRRYRIMQGNSPSGSTLWTVLKPWIGLSPEVYWKTGALCNGGLDISVDFTPNGSADPATLCIRDGDGNERYRVIVTATSGRVRID